MFSLKFSDSKIIDCLLKGEGRDGRAIEQLLDDNRSKIAAYILKNSGNSSDAETVLVEGVTALIFNVRKGKFKGDSALNTYLFAICRGIWLKKLKANKRFVDSENDENVIFESPSPLDLYNNKQITEEVNSLLKRLGESCEKVLRLWAHHYSMVEIADALAYKNAQVAMNKKNKCLTKLKGIIQNTASSNELLELYLN